jgi:hypothetical protein
MVRNPEGPEFVFDVRETPESIKRQRTSEFKYNLELVLKIWRKAIEASAVLVRAENAKGHNGQEMFNRALLEDFEEVQEHLDTFSKDNDKDIEDLRSRVELLLTRTENFIWPGNWCPICGMPLLGQLACTKCVQIEERKVKHDRFHDYVVPSSKSARAKKPGSAARRGNGHTVNTSVRPRDRKKGKGGKTAK